MMLNANRTPGRDATSVGGSNLFSGDYPGGLATALCIVLVQPLTNVVANYTCQHGDNKGNDVIQRKSPPSNWKEFAVRAIVS